MPVSSRASEGLRFVGLQIPSPIMTDFIKKATNGSSQSEQLIPGMPVLDDTPPRGTFPIPESKLIELGKKLYAAQGGIDDESLLADDFK